MKKNRHKRKINIKKNLFGLFKIMVGIGIIVFLIWAGVSFNTKRDDYNYNIIQEQLNEKQNSIEELQKEIKELQEKDKTIEKDIKKIKTAKNKATTTRGSTSRSVTASTTPITGTEKWIWANTSAYCPCKHCCGKTNGITASGTKATAGRTIAASSSYKFGTKIEIEGMGIYVVEDRGGAITGNKIDIFFNTHSEALKFGRRQLKIRVVE